MGQILCVGFDLCDDFSQISCYNRKTTEIDSICTKSDYENYLIPTVLSVKNDTKEWFYGEDAENCAKRGEGVLIKNILQRIKSQEKFSVFDMEISAEVILEKFFRKTLSLLKIHYPNDSIKKLVVTVDGYYKPYIFSVIYSALENLGIGKDRAIIQSHEQSYVYYALNQKKELWMNDIGLFEFNENGVFYHQIEVSRKSTSKVVRITSKNFSETLNYDMLKDNQSKESILYIFDNLAKNVMYKQVISTLYLTGIAFEEDWALSAIKNLAIGRRVFKGMNLYTKGACYYAVESAGDGNVEKFVLLTEDAITSTITIKVYFNAKIQEIILAKAGTPWYEVEQNVDIIPDNEEEVQIIVKNIMKKESIAHLLTLDGFVKRPNKTIRLTVRIRFVDQKTCVVSLKDKGFGEFYPTNNRIWEKVIMM